MVSFSRTSLLIAAAVVLVSVSCASPTRSKGVCGDGVLNAGEECDDGMANSDMRPDACRTDCTLPHCGDGVVDSGEECDGVDLAGRTCSQLGFTGGTLACTDECTFDTSRCFRCGNGVREEGEECDGTDFAGLSCTSLGFSSGTLRCTGSCTVDTSQCVGGCGNGVKEEGEECDGTDVGGVTCEDLGFESGTVGCTDGCTLSLATCVGGCGNSIVEDGESCDLGRTTGYDGCVQCRQGDGTFRVMDEFEVPSHPIGAALLSATPLAVVVATADASLQDGTLLEVSDHGTEVVAEHIPFVALAPCGGAVWASAMGPDGAGIMITVDADGASQMEIEEPALTIHCNDGTPWMLGMRTKTLYALSAAGFEPVIPIGGYPSDFALTDFDGDGHTDVVVLRSGSGLVSVYYWSPEGYRLKLSRYAGEDPLSVSVGDGDADGDPDILVTYRHQAQLGAIMNEQWGQDFSGLRLMNIGEQAWRAIFHHLDGDGLEDLVLLSPSSMTTFLSADAWHFTGADSVRCSGARDLHLVDIDGDGIHDGVLTCYGEDTIRIVEAVVR